MYKIENINHRKDFMLSRFSTVLLPGIVFIQCVCENLCFCNCCKNEYTSCFSFESYDTTDLTNACKETDIDIFLPYASEGILSSYVCVKSILDKCDNTNNLHFIFLHGFLTEAELKSVRSFVEAIRNKLKVKVSLVDMGDKYKKHSCVDYFLSVPWITHNDKAIWLCGNLFARGAIENFFKTDISSFYCAGVGFDNGENLGPNHDFFRCDVLLLNCAKIRENLSLQLQFVNFLSAEKKQYESSLKQKKAFLFGLVQYMDPVAPKCFNLAVGKDGFKNLDVIYNFVLDCVKGVGPGPQSNSNDFVSIQKKDVFFVNFYLPRPYITANDAGTFSVQVWLNLASNDGSQYNNVSPLNDEQKQLVASFYDEWYNLAVDGVNFLFDAIKIEKDFFIFDKISY
jgi:hypothetical protein